MTEVRQRRYLSGRIFSFLACLSLVVSSVGVPVQAASENIVKLAVTDTALQAETGQRVRVNVQLQNQTGAGEQPTSGDQLKLTAATTSTTGKFFDRSNSATHQTEFTQTSANRSVLYQDTTPGTYTLNFTVSGGGLAKELTTSADVAVTTSTQPTGPDTVNPVIITPITYSDGTPVADSIVRGTKTIVATQEETNPKDFTIEYQQKNSLGEWQTLTTARSDTTRVELVVDTAETTDGLRRVVISSQDQAGNSASESALFTTDNTAPTNLTAKVGDTTLDGATLRRIVKIAFSQTDVNPASVTARYQQNSNGEWQTRTETSASGDNGNLEVDTRKWPNGGYRLVVVAKDKAGNATTREIGFTVDNPPPLPPLALGALRYDAANTQLLGTVNDQNAVVTVAIGGTTYTARVLPTPTPEGLFTWALDVSGLPASVLLYQATVTATQGARNTSSVVTFRVPAPTDTGAVQSIDASGRLATIQPINSSAVIAGRPTTRSATILNPAVVGSDMTTTQGILEETPVSTAAITASPGDSSAAIESSSSGWKIFGLAWYWWVMITAIVGAVAWFFWPRLMKFGSKDT